MDEIRDEMNKKKSRGPTVASGCRNQPSPQAIYVASMFPYLAAPVLLLLVPDIRMLRNMLALCTMGVLHSVRNIRALCNPLEVMHSLHQIHAKHPALERHRKDSPHTPS